MDLTKAYTLANSLIQAYEINKEFSITLTTDYTHVGSCSGKAYTNYKGIKRVFQGQITLNIDYIQDSNEEEVKDVILHEIAHALQRKYDDSTGHDEIWKTLFINIGGSGKEKVGQIL